MYVTFDPKLEWHTVEVDAERTAIFGSGRAEHRAFITRNCTRGDWSMTWESRNETARDPNNPIIRFKRAVYVFVFEDKTDAMHFKLRFG